MSEPGRVQNRQSLLDQVWGSNFVGDANVLDVYVRYLRRKLEPPGQPTLIQTVRGVGFLLKAGPLKETAP
jgi:two-component system response regulator MprA